MTASIYDAPDLYAMLCEQSRSHDIDFYVSLAREVRAKNVLEYGIGAGRVSIPLARAGHAVFGVERSEAMLGRLAANVARESEKVRARVGFRHGDAREVVLEARFDLAIAPFNALAELVDDDAIVRVLDRAREHLTPGGTLAFDVLAVDPSLRGASFTAPFFRDPRTGAASRCTQDVAHDEVARAITVTTRVHDMEHDRGEEVLALRQRQLSPAEAIALVERSGFEVVWQTERFSTPASRGHDGLESDAIAYVCRRR